MSKIHMIAICGTGMGSLAGLLKEKGHDVSGSDDNVYPPMSDQLKSQNIPVKIGFKKENIENPDFVVVGNACSKNHVEVVEAQTRNLKMISMPEAIETLLIHDRFPVVIAGTHGKTTTSSLMAWVLERCGQNPGFLIGGIPKNFGKSFQIGNGDYFVLEGDEYDSAFFDKEAKFLHYHPQILILNPVEFDHADIYKDLDHVLSAFAKLISSMSTQSLIFACGDSSNVRDLIRKAPGRVVTYGINPTNDLHPEHLDFSGTTAFECVQNHKSLGRIESPLLGRHNVSNLLGILGVALELGIPFNEIRQAISEFQGVKRRQEILGIFRDVTLIDDFAHHPTAVTETLRAIRNRYPSNKIWAIFEPRSNTTRRKVFQKDFVTSFGPADEVVFAAPYMPEKIPEAERLEPEELIRDLQASGKKASFIPSVDQIVAKIVSEARAGDVVCFMSNGGFGGIYQKMIQAFSRMSFVS